jgi:hypothetical protein
VKNGVIQRSAIELPSYRAIVWTPLLNCSEALTVSLPSPVLYDNSNICRVVSMLHNPLELLLLARQYWKQMSQIILPLIVKRSSSWRTRASKALLVTSLHAAPEPNAAGALESGIGLLVKR